ncbi:hypothetical protein EGM88_07530 [Aureibaculum marinum]|uniref:KAP NTPase domain-containing protein n=1 Tax=Aureibaculum marinum TaxID=2487930 RepID=A0A3N4NQU2_9FLAO|nr:P-loop NTPase fold protein [Aureibaculum marinum]RPD98005.1 hypothetical protein EGM88_07530 [Aureibaculum marinum]
MMSYYYLTGSDGSGKTTFIKKLQKELKSKNIKTTSVWLRSPKITSKPLMAYCRLVGLTKYKIIDGEKYGAHHFYKSKFVSKIFPYLQFIDFKLKWYLIQKKIPKNTILLFDRFNIDTLADLMVDTKNLELHRSYIGKKFLNFLPNRNNVIILMVKEDIIRQRKKDTLYDEQLSFKLKVYNKLGEDLNIKIIDNNKDYQTVYEDIKNYLKI